MKIVPNKRENSFRCAIKRFIFIKKRFGSAAISLLIIVYCTYIAGDCYFST